MMRQAESMIQVMTTVRVSPTQQSKDKDGITFPPRFPHLFSEVNSSTVKDF